MAQNRVDNIQVNAPKDIDNKRGVWSGSTWRPYNNITEAKLTIPVEIRYPTLIVNILKSGLPTEYWWRDGILDENLIEKIPDIPDATNSIKGKLKLTNHLGGTADAPIVVAVETKATSDSSNAPASTAFVKGVIAEMGDEGSSYVLPKSTPSILGGIKIGSGLISNLSGITSLQVKTINGNSIIGPGNINISGGGGGGGGSQTLQQTLNLGRIGDKIQITESLQIPTITPSIINAGNIWIGAGTSGGGGGGGGGGITLTTTGSSGASTLISGVLNIPVYSGGGGGSSAWGSITGTLSSQTDLNSVLLSKQPGLVSGTNIKTINGNSLLGSGDLVISGGGGGSGSVTNVSSANSDISVANTTTTPTLTLNSSVNPTASTIVKRDGGGGIFFTLYGDKIIGGTQGIINYDAGTTGYGEHNFKVNSGQLGFKVNTDRTLTAPRYASGGTAPTTTGATKMMVVDTNGLFSFKNEPALSQTLQQTLDIGRIGDSMKITTSMEIPTSAPSTINTGSVWVGTGTSAGSLTKTKVNSLSDLTSTSLSIGSTEASKYLVSTNASAIAGTITSGTALTSVFVRQGGAGKITFTGSGVTVLVKSGKVARTEGQNAVVEIFYETTTRVVITGDLDT